MELECENMSDMDKIQEECTHNCMTCGAGCAEHEGEAKNVTLEKALNAISEIDSDDLLKALQSIAEDDK